jgi:hypothetical protein
VLELLAGKWIAQAVATFAELGVADALAGGAGDVADVARELGCREEPLRRLLLFLAGQEIVEFVDDKCRLTAVGQALTRNRLGDLARFVGAGPQWHACGRLQDTIRTGQSAFALQHGAAFYQWLGTRPEAAEQYGRAIDDFTRSEARALVAAFDFSRAGCVLDVAGGHGTLLEEIVRRWPHVRATLMEMPHVCRAARPRLAAAGVAVTEGDLLAAVPSGYDIYVLKHVLHNFGDDDARGILQRSRAAMHDDAALLVIEGMLLPGVQRDPLRLLDLEMMVLFEGGRERSKNDFRRLVGEAGLHIAGPTVALGPFARLLVAKTANRDS